MAEMTLHSELPADMTDTRGLPGVQPEHGPWLRVDETYAAQMARRIALLDDVPEQVLYLETASQNAAQELLHEALNIMPTLGFTVEGAQVTCPDGRKVDVSSTTPLEALGRCLQNDFVILEKRGDEHVFTGAVLCFPASWSLAEKVGRPLREVHIPVDEYTENVARRVQRLFDGIQVGRPLWRFNQLWYQDAELHQPRSAAAPLRVGSNLPDGPFYRSERQTLLRLPLSRAVIFVIHTYVLARADVPELR
ncbi:heme-dependent oxidative N-demethylase family protein [Tateyamaria sp.]|uniref:heme-dependent oxidative N-demethylase family protein n=2 Tax=Tateyamaria sp. TaxID=1929288 RepID=UPI0032A07792